MMVNSLGTDYACVLKIFESISQLPLGLPEEMNLPIRDLIRAPYLNPVFFQVPATTGLRLIQISGASVLYPIHGKYFSRQSMSKYLIPRFCFPQSPSGMQQSFTDNRAFI